jgi:hypothetical protein
MSPKEMGKNFVEGRAKIPLETVGECDMILDIKTGGWDWMYSRYGITARDRGITEKRPFWYVLRSLLATFNQRKQEGCSALSGISVSDSLIPASQEEEGLLVSDAHTLRSFHYLLASNWRYKQAVKMKHAWYAIARANPAIACVYRKGKTMGGKTVYFATYTQTFAQILENLKTPGEDGLRYLIPEFLPHCFFLTIWSL